MAPMMAALFLGSIMAEGRAESGMLAEGRALAEKNCAGCHAIGKTGVSPHRDAPPFRMIAARSRVDDLQEALAEGITVGHPDMPEFQLEPVQIMAFLSYLKSLAPPAE
jgi:mono/diheme cytochrome c family protein